jgi:hypothetical protein
VEEALLKLPSGVVCFMVGGDDSWTASQVDGEPEYMGIDYSHFDQSQKDCQVAAELEVLAGLGVPRSILSILHVIATNTAHSNSRSSSPKPVLRLVPKGAGRITGGPNTSLSNSTNNLLALMIFHLRGRKPEVWKQLGLTAKMEVSKDLMQVSFLRGVFWPYADKKSRWGQMPSAMLKLGKVQTVVKTKKRLLQLAYGQGLGMGDVPLDFPILGPLRERLIALGSQSISLRHEYNPLPDYNRGVMREEIIDWMVERYAGVTRDDILYVEQEIRAITELPWFIGHHLFKAMMVDYA